MATTTTRRPRTPRPQHPTRGRIVLAAEPTGVYRAAGNGMQTAVAPDGQASREDGAGNPLGASRAAVAVLRDNLSDDVMAGMDVDGLRGLVGLLRQLEGLTAATLARAVRLLDRRGAVDADGASSTTEWVKTNLGRSARAANRLVRLGANLADLPATADALAAGRITAETADVIGRATGDPDLGDPADLEAELTNLAVGGMSPEDLRAEIRRRRQAARADSMHDDERRQHARRSASITRRDDGMWRLHALLDDETGARWQTAIDAFEHPDPSDTPLARRRRPDQRRADALADIVTVVLDSGAAPTVGGIRPHLNVTVDLATITTTIDPARPVDDPAYRHMPAGATDWGSRLSPQAVRRIVCDATVTRIVTAGTSQPIDVGRATRNWNPAQRRAVNTRDRQCRGPRCTRPIGWTNIHHIAWWHRDHGPTAVDNGIALCHHCHRLIHDHGWTLDFDPTTATATWTAPTGQVTETRPPPG